MLSITSVQSDNASFLTLVSHIADRTIRQFHPAKAFLVRTDNWFDHKWLGFSGKVLGAVGVAKSRLTIPPFVPNRVVSQAAYLLDKRAGAYTHTDAPPLHLAQPSRKNLTRFIDRVTKSGVFIWFSGDTQQSRTGCVMVYALAEDLQISWYASFQRTTFWQINKVSGLSKSELVQLTDGVLDGQGA